MRPRRKTCVSIQDMPFATMRTSRFFTSELVGNRSPIYCNVAGGFHGSVRAAALPTHCTELKRNYCLPRMLQLKVWSLSMQSWMYGDHSILKTRSQRSFSQNETTACCFCCRRKHGLLSRLQSRMLTTQFLRRAANAFSVKMKPWLSATIADKTVMAIAAVMGGYVGLKGTRLSHTPSQNETTVRHNCCGQNRGHY